MLRHLVAHTRCHSKKIHARYGFCKCNCPELAMLLEIGPISRVTNQKLKKNRSSLSGCGRNLPWTTDAAVGNGRIVAQILRATGTGNGCTWCLRVTSGRGEWMNLFVFRGSGPQNDGVLGHSKKRRWSLIIDPKPGRSRGLEPQENCRVDFTPSFSVSQ